MMTRFVIPMTLEVLEKARKSPRLIPVTRMVTRGGKTFPQVVWMLPEDVKAGKTGGAQGSLFDDVGPAPVIQGDLFDDTPEEPKAVPQDVSGILMADGDFPKDVLRDGVKIGKITEARLNGKVVNYNVRNLQGALIGSAKTPDEALAKFKDGIKKEEPTETDKPFDYVSESRRKPGESDEDWQERVAGVRAKEIDRVNGKKFTPEELDDLISKKKKELDSAWGMEAATLRAEITKLEKERKESKTKPEEFTFDANGDTKTARVALEDRKTISGGTKQVKVISVYGSKDKETPEWTKQVETDEVVSRSWVERLHKKYGNPENTETKKDQNIPEYDGMSGAEVRDKLMEILSKGERKDSKEVREAVEALRKKMPTEETLDKFYTPEEEQEYEELSKRADDINAKRVGIEKQINGELDKTNFGSEVVDIKHDKYRVRELNKQLEYAKAEWREAQSKFKPYMLSRYTREPDSVGSTKTVNGVTYRLNENHRWEKVEEDTTDPKIKKIMEDWNRDAKDTYITTSEIASDYGTSPAWIAKHFDEMVNEGKLVKYDNGKKTFYAIPNTTGATTLAERERKQVAAQAEVDAIAEKLKNLIAKKKDSTTSETETNETPKVEAPKEKPLEEVPIGEDGLSDMRRRVTVGEHKMSSRGITYTFDAIMKDGVPVGKLSEVWVGSSGKQWYVAPLKERKRRSNFVPFEELVPPCTSKEDVIEKMIMRLFNEEQEEKARDAEKKERAQKIKDAKRQAAISNATPATRKEVEGAYYAGDDLIPVKHEPYLFTPSDTQLSIGEETVTAKDYTGALPNRVVLANKKTILENERPSYIPEIKEDWFSRMEYRLEGAKIGPDRYIITTNRTSGSIMGYHESDVKKSYAVVNLAVLVTTQDYYKKLATAKLERDIENAKKLAEDVADIARKIVETGNDGPSVVNSMEKYKGLGPASSVKLAVMAGEIVSLWKRNNELNAKRGGFTLEQQIESYSDRIERSARSKHVKTIGKDKATRSHLALLKSSAPDKNEWKAFSEYINDLKQGGSDMELQMEENESSFTKGRETSYGRKGSMTYLQDSHGILVKRQNGDEITAFEVDEIKKAIDAVYSVYGDRSEMAKRNKLLVSHSGEKLMHAMKFAGVYFPGQKAIGVTWGNGQKGAGFTLAHEFAHFIDNEMGLKGKRNHYASDDPTSLEHEIADTFRKNMKESQTSDYMNRTCECFARAMEQYFATETGDAVQYQLHVNATGNHPEQKVFMEKVHPLIKRFFTEKGEMLKSINIWRIA